MADAYALSFLLSCIIVYFLTRKEKCYCYFICVFHEYLSFMIVVTNGKAYTATEHCD